MARYRVGLETRRRILDATRETLGDGGIDGVTLKAITDRAGVGAGSFYNLFESKEQAVLEVVRDAIEAVDPDPSGRGDESLDDLVGAFVEFFVGGDSADVARIYLQLAVGAGLTDERMAGHVRRSHHARVERFAEAMRRESPGLDVGQARVRAERLLAALTGFAVTSLLDPSFDLPSNTQALLAFVRRGG